MLFDVYFILLCCFFFFKQKTAYEMRISDWSSDVCSSDLERPQEQPVALRERTLGGSRSPARRVIDRQPDPAVAGIEQRQIGRVRDRLAKRRIGAGRRHQHGNLLAIGLVRPVRLFPRPGRARLSRPCVPSAARPHPQPPTTPKGGYTPGKRTR